MASALEAPLPALAWCPTTRSPRCREPAVMVLFGSTGDLTQRKLLPAIYSLTADGLLECGLPIVCVGRRDPDREALLLRLREGVARFARRRPLDEDLWQEVAQRVHYVRGDLDDPGTYAELKSVLDWAGSACRPGLGRLFYLATPPGFFPSLLTNLERQGLAGDHAFGEGWTRLAIEKPFGQDSDTARALGALLRELYHEDQIYRVDHYLGKETVQNLIVLRFANRIFEPLWNEHHIDRVEITVAEKLGMEGRGTYFDSAGILRDIVQNHVLQMLALVAMEPPASMDPEALQDEKVKVLRSLRRMDPEEIDRCTVRGRYAPGSVESQPVPGYLSEPHVAAGSRTETYVALRAYVDNWRWAGVPFYLRAGKRMPRSVTEIAVTFKCPPHLVFRGATQRVQPNRLVLRVQPREGVQLFVSSKAPGPGLEITPVALDFRYDEAFAHEPPEAYERLFLDALVGDRTLFARADSVEAAWDYVTPLLRRWEARADAPIEYPAGSWGPAEADDLLAETGGHWHEPE